MSLPNLFSLSHELLIEIFSNLSPLDIYSCQRTCRQLNELIVNSQLLQYISRATLSGVFDPLEPGLSLPDRLDALGRWETAWLEMDLREPDAIIDVPVFTENGRRPDSGLFSGQYFIVYQKYALSRGYAFLDMHARSSLHASAVHWTTIKIDTPNILALAFASEPNLAVAVSAPTSIIDVPKTTYMISFLCFSTGKPHPLASQPNLEVSIFSTSRHELSVIGDYILYRVGKPGYGAGHMDALGGIYLVAWKEGWVSELRTSDVYTLFLSVLSKEIILLIRPHEPSLELCRLSNIDDREKASLETVRILCLPVFAPNTFFYQATCFDKHPDHALFSKNGRRDSSPHPPPLALPSTSSDPSTRQPEDRVGARRRLHFVPMDSVVIIQMIVLGRSCVIDLTMRRGTLFELIDSQPQADPRYAAEMGIGAGTMLRVPWESWGPANSRIRVLELNILNWPVWSSLTGERRVTAKRTQRTCIITRDYNPFRVQRALALLGGTGGEVMLECGSVVKVVKEPSAYCGGEWFRDDIETSLPYIETTTPYTDDTCEGVFMDEGNLLVQVHTEAGEKRYLLHSL